MNLTRNDPTDVGIFAQFGPRAFFDTPMATLWPRLACAFPNYKLVHTTRSDYHGAPRQDDDVIFALTLSASQRWFLHNFLGLWVGAGSWYVPPLLILPLDDDDDAQKLDSNSTPNKRPCRRRLGSRRDNS